MRPALFFASVLPLWAGGCLLPASEPAASAPEVLIEQGRFSLALASLANPAAPASEAKTAYLRSKAEAGLGDLEASLHSAERASALEPESAAYHVQLAAACGRLAAKANMLRQLGLARHARKELDLALQKEPANIDALYGHMLFLYAAPSFLGGDRAKAEAAAQAIIKLHPARGYLAHAQLARERKDESTEEADYRSAISADPRFYEARAFLASFLLTRDRAAAATEACEAIQLDDQRAAAWITLVEASAANQCWDEMLQQVAAARAAIPEDREVEYAVGVALVRMGMHYRWAIEFLERYRGPNEAAARAKLAEARERIAAALASH